MKILVTGAAGFIGFHVSQELLGRGEQVNGLDNPNEYYDLSLKIARLELRQRSSIDRGGTEALFESEKFDSVVHLAAQAGVRHSIEHPRRYGPITPVEVGVKRFVEWYRSYYHA